MEILIKATAEEVAELIIGIQDRSQEGIDYSAELEQKEESVGDLFRKAMQNSLKATIQKQEEGGL